MKTVFIIRTESRKDFDNDFIKLIRVIWSSDIKDIYILSNFSKDDYKIDGKPTTIVYDKNPISSISINTALQKIKEDKINLNAFLISSKEIYLTKRKIKKLIEEIEKANNSLLVVGYKFKIKEDSFLDNELKSYYANKNLIAYKVPWNTCAIWKYELFDKYVSKFDEITARNSFNQICVSIDGICSLTPHKGMEDGLAIAQATSDKEKKQVYFELLNKYLPWKVKDPKKHREKLARKDTVLRNFMAIRNYSERDLLKAEIK